jgi:hypothetical protein
VAQRHESGSHERAAQEGPHRGDGSHQAEILTADPAVAFRRVEVGDERQACSEEHGGHRCPARNGRRRATTPPGRPAQDCAAGKDEDAADEYAAVADDVAYGSRPRTHDTNDTY